MSARALAPLTPADPQGDDAGAVRQQLMRQLANPDRTTSRTSRPGCPSTRASRPAGVHGPMSRRSAGPSARSSPRRQPVDGRAGRTWGRSMITGISRTGATRSRRSTTCWRTARWPTGARSWHACDGNRTARSPRGSCPSSIGGTTRRPARCGGRSSPRHGRSGAPVPGIADLLYKPA